MHKYSIENVRKDVLGNNILFNTPFGERHLLYADYTASGRGVRSIEDKIINILQSYANTHTEDDYSGKYLTHLLHQAEVNIKQFVNAGENGKIIATGSGTTGALKKLQEILGVFLPPVTKEKIFSSLSESGEFCQSTLERIIKHRPVVFIGPYEHHTNELMWREAFVEVVKIGLDQHGQIDLKNLHEKLSDSKYKNRQKMSSFSAGSNITGIKTNVYDIARICHEHNSFVFFDFAAIAPYVEINMNKDDTAYFDAIFFSPHKFLGGPGSSGVLVFNEKIYRQDLPPTAAGGGTVIYVGFNSHDFSNDIETREKAGTPPILQTIRASLAMELKENIGIEAIDEMETRHKKYFIGELENIKNVKIIGRVPPEQRVPIVSFNIKHNEKILHPKFVTKLMSDLFGIQSRGGCSCAGPYGHLLLGIGEEQSEKYRNLTLKGLEGFKIGWVRLNVHYIMAEEDVDYILKAIKFITKSGHLFLKKYTFNAKTGEWKHIEFNEEGTNFSIDADFRPKIVELLKLQELRDLYIKKAEEIALELKKEEDVIFARDSDEVEEIKFFEYIHKAL